MVVKPSTSLGVLMRVEISKIDDVKNRFVLPFFIVRLYVFLTGFERLHTATARRIHGIPSALP